ncbi:MAG: AraC family transcriptional regulator [Pseudomonadota bacterium]
MTKYIAKPDRAHPEVIDPPHGRCWRRSGRRRYGAGPQAHDELVALLGLSGSADYLLGGHVHKVERGTLVWALSGQAHVLLRDSSDFDMWVFLISGQLLPEVEEGLPPLRVDQWGPLPPRRIPEGDVQRLDQLAQETFQSSAPKAQGAGLLWWLARAWLAWTKCSDAGARAVHPAVARAASLLRDDPSLDLASLARMAGLSPGRLSAAFRRETGQSIVDYRTDQKLGRVEEHLALGERNLTRAALDAGFGSYSQFYRAFTARRGQSPRNALLAKP